MILFMKELFIHKKRLYNLKGNKKNEGQIINVKYRDQ